MGIFFFFFFFFFEGGWGGCLLFHIKYFVNFQVTQKLTLCYWNICIFAIFVGLPLEQGEQEVGTGK